MCKKAKARKGRPEVDDELAIKPYLTIGLNSKDRKEVELAIERSSLKKSEFVRTSLIFFAQGILTQRAGIVDHAKQIIKSKK